jgi:excisionase family DNA binding protein
VADDELPEVLTLQEIAVLQRVSRRTVLGWCRSGSLPADRLGDSIRGLCPVRREDYLAFLKPNEPPPEEPQQTSPNRHFAEWRQRAVTGPLPSPPPNAARFFPSVAPVRAGRGCTSQRSDKLVDPGI